LLAEPFERNRQFEGVFHNLEVATIAPRTMTDRGRAIATPGFKQVHTQAFLLSFVVVLLVYLASGARLLRFRDVEPAGCHHSMSIAWVTPGFLEHLPSLWITPRWERLFHIPDEFLERLCELAWSAPVNRDTSHHQVMLTIFDSNISDLAMNCLCSSLAVGISPDSYIFVALDPEAYRRMNPFKTELLLLDLPDRNMTVPELQRFRHFMT
jgi:hypothetical protein